MGRCRRRKSGCRRRLVVVLASFLVNVLVAAVARCTGVFFSSFQNEFQSTSAQTGAISGIASSSSFFGCTLSGVLVNRFGCRIATVVGGLVSAAGLLGFTLAGGIYEMYVLSAVTGTGTGLAFAAANVIVAQYFEKGFPLAWGIANAGFGVGFVIFGPFIQLLLDTYGWRGTVLVICAVASNVCVAGAAFRPKPPSRKVVTANDPREPRQHQAIVNSSTTASRTPMSCFRGAVKLLRLNLLYRSYRLSMLCFAEITFVLCYSSYLVYIIPLANSSGVVDQKAALLIAALGVGNCVGSPLGGLLTQHVPALLVLEVSKFASGCSVLLVQLQNYPCYVISSAAFGLVLGTHATARQVMICEFVGVDNLASAYGIFAAFGGLADVISPIVAGSLYDSSGSFYTVFYLLAGSSFVRFLFMLSIPLLRKIEPGVCSEVAV